MNIAAQMDLILNLLYNADAAAREYPEALREDLTFDLRKLISLVEEDKAHADAAESAESAERFA